MFDIPGDVESFEEALLLSSTIVGRPEVPQGIPKKKTI